MKAVLMSIKPKWCHLIANGAKTVEVRKTKPKLGTPFKCYIYCTKKNTRNPHELLEYHTDDGKIRKMNGMVIGEFVCDQIYQWSSANVEGLNISKDEITKMSCLTEDELFRYEYSSEPKEGCLYLFGLYAWHISNLTIYKRPKEVSTLGISRAPQSWCYVEGLENTK